MALYCIVVLYCVVVLYRSVLYCIVLYYNLRYGIAVARLYAMWYDECLSTPDWCCCLTFEQDIAICAFDANLLRLMCQCVEIRWMYSVLNGLFYWSCKKWMSVVFMVWCCDMINAARCCLYVVCNVVVYLIQFIICIIICITIYIDYWQ